MSVFGCYYYSATSPDGTTVSTESFVRASLHSGSVEDLEEREELEELDSESDELLDSISVLDSDDAIVFSTASFRDMGGSKTSASLRFGVVVDISRGP